MTMPHMAADAIDAAPRASTTLATERSIIIRTTKKSGTNEITHQTLAAVATPSVPEGRPMKNDAIVTAAVQQAPT